MKYNLKLYQYTVKKLWWHISSFSNLFPSAVVNTISCKSFGIGDDLLITSVAKSWTHTVDRWPLGELVTNKACTHKSTRHVIRLKYPHRYFVPRDRELSLSTKITIKNGAVWMDIQSATTRLYSFGCTMYSYCSIRLLIKSWYSYKFQHSSTDYMTYSLKVTTKQIC